MITCFRGIYYSRIIFLVDWVTNLESHKHKAKHLQLVYLFMGQNVKMLKKKIINLV